MIRKIILVISFLYSVQTIAQTGIGTTSPNASARLDVSATNKGFLPPRIALLSTTDVVTIASPATGLVIYNTATAGTTPNNVLPGYYYYDGSKWNGLVNQGALQSFSGYVPNYAQSNAGSVTKVAAGDIVVSQSITTAGRPVQIIATGDANPMTAGAWLQLQLYRDGTAIGKKVQVESSASNENVPYCLNFIDNPTAGTYTYSVKIVTGSGSNFQFGEADGNQITLLELGAWSAGTMPVSKGGTGSTSYTTGSLLFSNGTTITQNNSKLFWDNNNNRLGVGTSSPSQTLDVNGNVNVSGDVNITGKINLTDPSGNVVTKITRRVDAGEFVTMDNLKVTVTTSGSRGLAVATVSGTMSLYVQGIYVNGVGSISANRTTAPISYSTTLSTSMFGWSFGSAGDHIIYHFTDAVNTRLYRVTLIIMPDYIKNFITIERLI